MGEGRPPPSSPLNPPLQVDKGEARAAKAIIFFYKHNTTSSCAILHVYGYYDNVSFNRLALLGLYYFAT